MAALQSNLLRLLLACCRKRVGSIRILRPLALAILVAFFSVSFAATSVDAAFVSTQEAEMDAIFGQASFGANPIDIRYLPTLIHVDPNLLDINNSTKLSSLFSLVPPPRAHNVYYVDSVDWCGGFNEWIVGCGNRPGNDFVVESVYAGGINRRNWTSVNGAELIAHELGHNLSLWHVGNSSSRDNLMNPTVGYPAGPTNDPTALTVSQANTILGRYTVQTDGSGRFIQIQPVLIVASAIPEPSSLLIAVGLFSICGLGFRRRRP